MKEKGITLIALIVTIIVLIILAGITIATLTGDDGIINNANNAKEETEIANEKEIVDRATINAMGNNKRGNIVRDELQDELDRITKVGDTEVEDSGEEFEVVFVNTNRYYTVDKDGDIIEEGKIVIDKSPGDITKDENGEELDGNTKETAYEIWCIEDLVEYSKIMNSTSSSTVSNKYIKLCQTLNFKSKLSYVDYGTTIYDEFLGGDGNTSLIEQLSENGKGFYPINGSPLKNTGIAKEFDGQGFKIKNIYINQEEDAGFVGKATNLCVKNLTITGIIISINKSAGGICGSVLTTNSIIDNCYNYAIVKNYSSDGSCGAGGIIGSGTATITNSSNYGEIIAEKNAGGLSGNSNGLTVINCANLGKITSNTDIAGGIVGFTNSTTGGVYIYNSYNLGNINGSIAGGIIGYVYNHAECINVYSTGNITGNTVGGIVGSALWNNTSQNKFENCYFLKSDTVQKSAGSKIIVNASMLDNLTDTTINELNSYISNNGSLTYEWKKWTLGSDGYPVFV